MAPLLLRYMTLDDIPQVMRIDRAAFSTPWSVRSYEYEVGESTYSYMLVITQHQPQDSRPLLRVWLRRLPFLRARRPSVRILAYGGLWRFLEEAHISTIASHPDYRGQGYGELALAAMIRRAAQIGARFVALEVRVSNTGAQQLYRKWGFVSRGIKTQYYRDNREDAYDMRLTLDEAALSDVEARFKALQQRHAFRDDYTQRPPPRERSNR